MIIKQKYQEMAQLKSVPVKKRLHNKSFKKSLCNDSLSIIAEIKRKSPSKGNLALITDPVALAKQYVEGGASAISVLTDETFFSGSIDDLIQVASALSELNPPVLRKDFIIDKRQIDEAYNAGADAILAIVAVLGNRTKEIIEYANVRNLDVLVEVHDEYELDMALVSGAEIIGINNRNLKTFQIDTQVSLQLVGAIPKNIIKVAESGILSPELAKQYRQAGFDAVLIGEALVTAADPQQFIKACRGQN